MLEQTQHIDWIDGAKGVAILCVILEHCLPDQEKIYSWLHIGQSVPVFIFITAYLLTLHYKSFAEYYRRERILKMLRTVLPPFLLVMICEQIVSYVHYENLIGLKSLLFSGGCAGPGSYYLSVYLSIWFIMPIMIELVRRIPILVSFFIMLIISVCAEYLFAFVWNISHIPSIYRLSLARYMMVVWLGCCYTKFTSMEKKILVVFAAITGLLYLLSRVLNVSYTLSIVPDYWNTAHWYNVLYVFIPIMIFQKVKYNETMKWIGQHSWLIFCFQMFVFWCVAL